MDAALSQRSRSPRGFTVGEFIIVLVVGAVFVFFLYLLLFPSFGGGEPFAKSLAANDVQQIVTCIKTYYSEYGCYPTAEAAEALSTAPLPADTFFGEAAARIYRTPNGDLFNTLRDIPEGPNANYRENPLRVAFLNGRETSNARHPVSGFQPVSGGDPASSGCWFDPWGHQYGVAMDSNRDGHIDFGRQYGDFSGSDAPHIGAGAFSMGKDGALGSAGNRRYLDGGKKSDDVVSWQ